MSPVRAVQKLNQIMGLDHHLVNDGLHKRRSSSSFYSLWSVTLLPKSISMLNMANQYGNSKYLLSFEIVWLLASG